MNQIQFHKIYCHDCHAGYWEPEPEAKCHRCGKMLRAFYYRKGKGMENVITTEWLPVKMWLPFIELELGAWKQAQGLANMPFVHKHVALMPDAHVGYGVPIGCVFPAIDVVIPNAVGVDIGCGMQTIRTNIRAERLNVNLLKMIVSDIKKQIPMGFKHQKESHFEYLIPALVGAGLPSLPIVDREYKSAVKQLGTLGGGNHFIEIQEGPEGFAWVTIHSGSRNLGKQVADHYHKEAQKKNKFWMSETPKDLAFLPVDSRLGEQYINEMEYCVKFAKVNRDIMMDKVTNILLSLFPELSVTETIDIPHNYASLEEHFGKWVYVHRKGAVRVEKGGVGIIPGSMGDCTYIVQGLGNRQSFNSCSHGAGRAMGRKQAKKTLNIVKEKKIMEGIVCDFGERSLDEAPSAYKPIGQVIARQGDIFKVTHQLTPIANVKG